MQQEVKSTVPRLPLHPRHYIYRCKCHPSRMRCIISLHCKFTLWISLFLSEVVGQVDDGQLEPCATVYAGDLSSDLHVEHTLYGHRSMGPPASREWRAECDPHAHARNRTRETQSPHVTKELLFQTPSPTTGTTHLPRVRKTAREYGTTRACAIVFFFPLRHAEIRAPGMCM